MVSFENLEEFERDLKFLLKKFRSLEEDLDVIRKVLSVYPAARPPFSFRISIPGTKTIIIKIRKIACRSLKGSGAQSGFRLIYAWIPEEQKIIFVELYHKSQKESEDADRIRRNFS